MLEIGKVHFGDALELAKQMENESVNCIITSPPYFGLRDYKVEGQIGQEETMVEYVDNLTVLFRELRRVLRKDGTLWLNLGDSYAGSWGNYGSRKGKQRKSVTNRWERKAYENEQYRYNDIPPTARVKSLPPKNLLGIPWRVAFALQDDSWILRSEIIWHKPNGLPESIKDRPTRNHETIFLFSKSSRYYYDYYAIREEAVGALPRGKRANQDFSRPIENKEVSLENRLEFLFTRNKRSVWTVPTKPYPAAHFATFPPRLIEPCIIAGVPEKVCIKCNTSWRREVIKGFTDHIGDSETKYNTNSSNAGRLALLRQAARKAGSEYTDKTKDLELVPQCQCKKGFKPGIVLDPFMGSGTTMEVAIKNRREWIGFEINKNYEVLISERLENIQIKLL